MAAGCERSFMRKADLVMLKTIQERCTSVTSVTTVPQTSGISSNINANTATIYESSATFVTMDLDTTPK